MAGLLAILAIILGFALETTSEIFTSVYFGYLAMLLALIFLYIGVKRYRDTRLGGAISFGRGLALGLAITLVACITYALVWELYLTSTDFVFIDEYITASINLAHAEGLTGAALEARLAEINDMRVSLENPLTRLVISFMEFGPVGLLVSLISAYTLRSAGGEPARPDLS
jgi:uncharacterized membrane protein YhaH (DUF805 family)